jgi:hypothetical protein
VVNVLIAMLTWPEHNGLSDFFAIKIFSKDSQWECHF